MDLAESARLWLTFHCVPPPSRPFMFQINACWRDGWGGRRWCPAPLLPTVIVMSAAVWRDVYLLEMDFTRRRTMNYCWQTGGRAGVWVWVIKGAGGAVSCQGQETASSPAPRRTLIGPRRGRIVSQTASGRHVDAQLIYCLFLLSDQLFNFSLRLFWARAN